MNADDRQTMWDAAQDIRDGADRICGVLAALAKQFPFAGSAREAWYRMAHDLRLKDRAFAEEGKRRQAAESALSEATRAGDAALAALTEKCAALEKERDARAKEVKALKVRNGLLYRRMNERERDYQAGADLAIENQHRDRAATAAAEADASRLRTALGQLSAILEREIGHGLRWPPDHACAECQPNSEILLPGFRCARHAALVLVGHLPALTPPPVATPGGEEAPRVGVRENLAAIGTMAGAIERRCHAAGFAEGFEAAREETRNAFERVVARWARPEHGLFHADVRAAFSKLKPDLSAKAPPPDATAIRTVDLPAISGKAYRAAFEAAREEAPSLDLVRPAFAFAQRELCKYTGDGDRPPAPPAWLLWLNDHLDRLIVHRAAPPSPSSPPPPTTAPAPICTGTDCCRTGPGGVGPCDLSSTCSGFEDAHRFDDVAPPTTTPQPEKSQGDLCACVIPCPWPDMKCEACPDYRPPSAAKGGSK